MSGIVCLQGGREFTLHCRRMDAEILRLAPDGPVAVLAGAAQPGRDYGSAVLRARYHYGEIGKADVIAVPDPRDDIDAALAVLDGDIGLLVLPGGSPASLLDVLVGETPEIGERVIQLHRRGVAISGASAGAMVLCTHTYLDGGSRPTSQIMPGLGLVEGLALVHWWPGPRRNPLPSGIELWGLPECGGVVVSGDATWAVGEEQPSHCAVGEGWVAVPRAEGPVA